LVGVAEIPNTHLKGIIMALGSINVNISFRKMTTFNWFAIKIGPVHVLHVLLLHFAHFPATREQCHLGQVPRKPSQND